VGVAIGHFDFSDLVAVNGIVAGVRALNLPVMVGVSEGDAPFVGVRQATALVRAASRSSNCQSRTIRGPRKTSSYRDFVRPWATPFCASVGVFAVAMFAYLSATYAAYECEEPALREDFRSHAIASAISTGVLAGVVLLLSVHGAPIIWRGLTNRIWIWPLFWMTAILALAALYALWRRRYQLARFCAAGEVSLILWGWAFAQFPYVVVSNLTIYNSSSSPATIYMLAGALMAGSLVLLPSYKYLLEMFKSNALS
jgi:cytochrome bd-type quinol oxidase subunit 2